MVDAQAAGGSGNFQVSEELLKLLRGINDKLEAKNARGGAIKIAK